MAVEQDLNLADARAIVDRALEKARQLKQAGAFVVLDAGGNVVTVSRIGEGQTASVWVSRAKAYVSTLQEDGSCLVVERPPGWGLANEARYVARFKELGLGG